MRRRDGGTNRRGALEIRRKVLRWRAPGNSGPSPVRRPRARFAAAHSGCVGAPPGDTTVPCQELADGWRAYLAPPSESAARRSSENAAMERRKARRPRHGRSSPAELPEIGPIARRVTGRVRQSRQRRPALHSPRIFEGTTDPRRSPRAGLSGRRSVGSGQAEEWIGVIARPLAMLAEITRGNARP